MASLICDGDEGWRIQFTRPGDGKRLTFRTGEMVRRDAERCRDRIESLVSAAKQNRPPDDATAAWLSKLEGPLLTRLERTGLVPGSANRNQTLAFAIDKWLAGMTVKAGTKVAYEQVRRDLIKYFGADKPVSSIGPLEAEEWRQWLAGRLIARTGRPLSAATVNRRVKTCRQLFKRLRKWKLVTENPFEDVQSGSQRNKARERFITREQTQRVLDACPNIQWRVIVALSRFGGLRCSSEHSRLKWEHIDWERGRFLVHSPKTEGYAGKATRWVPLFPELRTILLEAFAEAEDGQQYVVKNLDAQVNLRTPFLRILKQAGLDPWPRLFHNLRATRQTELMDEFAPHVVCSWLGNTLAVAQDHYLQVTDAHFASAAVEKKPSEKVARIPAQYGPEWARKQLQEAPPEKTQTTGMPVVAYQCESSQSVRMGAEGFEPSKA
ncbi:tyrosine-type recombinase/integrase [Humisphaera borealis]|uniref:Tyrosine-type recombinase/integrase n=1 Tax=Humisphaera borealis TaxID=2807512 RepID=A0A7M2WZP3_9BACT|nr:site-specific integrase [Humisphaera borealis]QOV90662.1 tyrosine-type recombinase/integrase [Humisphaera borealis]